ncbi:MAG: FtsX-like permease family protein [Abditibacteriales bacterium]|nr:FtsX-like permease family protein [Abditibacteriales bacterium]MDW8368060.1 FtsX-like permease family protein [Abditibacteriales bacterium]
MTKATVNAESQEKKVYDVLLTRRTAQTLNVKVGDVLELSAHPSMEGARRFRVVGIYQPPPDPAAVGRKDLRMTMRLPDLERMTGSEDQVDVILVKLKNPAEREAVKRQLRAIGFGFDVYTTEELARRSSTPWQVVSRFHKAIGILTLVAGTVFLMALMTLRVEQRRQELGMLRLIGVSRATLFKTVLAETLLVAAGGSLGGVGGGYLAAWLINAYYQRKYETDLIFSQVTPAVIVVTLLLAMGMGILAGALTAWRIARARMMRLVGR